MAMTMGLLITEIIGDCWTSSTALLSKTLVPELVPFMGLLEENSVTKPLM
jgi:hypothetical protein